jgi:hypothetical protein
LSRALQEAGQPNHDKQLQKAYTVWKICPQTRFLNIRRRHEAFLAVKPTLEPVCIKLLDDLDNVACDEFQFIMILEITNLQMWQRETKIWQTSPL